MTDGHLVFEIRRPP